MARGHNKALARHIRKVHGGKPEAMCQMKFPSLCHDNPMNQNYEADHEDFKEFDTSGYSANLDDIDMKDLMGNENESVEDEKTKDCKNQRKYKCCGNGKKNKKIKVRVSKNKMEKDTKNKKIKLEDIVNNMVSNLNNNDRAKNKRNSPFKIKLRKVTPRMIQDAKILADNNRRQQEELDRMLGNLGPQEENHGLLANSGQQEENHGQQQENPRPLENPGPQEENPRQLELRGQQQEDNGPLENHGQLENSGQQEENLEQLELRGQNQNDNEDIEGPVHCCNKTRQDPAMVNCAPGRCAQKQTPAQKMAKALMKQKKVKPVGGKNKAVMERMRRIHNQSLGQGRGKPYAMMERLRQSQLNNNPQNEKPQVKKVVQHRGKNEAMLAQMEAFHKKQVKNMTVEDVVEGDTMDRLDAEMQEKFSSKNRQNFECKIKLTKLTPEIITDVKVMVQERNLHLNENVQQQLEEHRLLEANRLQEGNHGQLGNPGQEQEQHRLLENVGQQQEQHRPLGNHGQQLVQQRPMNVVAPYPETKQKPGQQIIETQQRIMQQLRQNQQLIQQLQQERQLERQQQLGGEQLQAVNGQHLGEEQLQAVDGSVSPDSGVSSQNSGSPRTVTEDEILAAQALTAMKRGGYNQ